MRIAIVSSPRSGNTWVRSILRDGLDLEEIAVHNYLDAVHIPERCVFQLHWYREPNFQDFLARHRFQIITLARHPLDVLISVLHFIRHEPDTAKWLGGNCELPEALPGRSPVSDEFLDYALSFGSENLLSVTYQWWHEKSAIRIRYEDFVAATDVEADKLAVQLEACGEHLRHAVAINSLEVFKALPNRHGWQGCPGLWRELIPYENAAAIYARHHRVFQTLGYSIDPTDLSREAAERNWTALVR
jgi:hypothetical protein